MSKKNDSKNQFNFVNSQISSSSIGEKAKIEADGINSTNVKSDLDPELVTRLLNQLREHSRQLEPSDKAQAKAEIKKIENELSKPKGNKSGNVVLNSLEKLKLIFSGVAGVGNILLQLYNIYQQFPGK